MRPSSSCGRRPQNVELCITPLFPDHTASLDVQFGNCLAEALSASTYELLAYTRGHQ